MMLKIKFTSASDPCFTALTQHVDDEYYQLYGDVVLKYRQYNTTEDLLRTAIAYQDGSAVGCGALKRFEEEAVELKRIFVQKPHRRRGIAELIVSALEKEAEALGFRRVVLETGADMTTAQALYLKLGYNYIDNFGPFAEDTLCVCMEKLLPANR